MRAILATLVLAVDGVLALGEILSRSRQSITSLTVLKHMLNKAKELLNRARKWKPLADGAFYHVRCLSVPLWKPWRDF
jgi:hypothetical protein